MRYVIPFLCITLSACGGSQTAVTQDMTRDIDEVDITLDVNEVASQADLNGVRDDLPRLGFANVDTRIGGGTSFEVENVPFIRNGDTSSSPILDDTDFVLIISEDGSQITVEVAGRRYLHDARTRSPGTYVVADPAPRGSDIEISSRFDRLFAPNDFVEYVAYDLEEGNLFFIGEGDELVEVFDIVFESSGIFLFGFETDPEIPNILVGSADYEGQMSVLLAGLEQYGFAEGDVELTVNFDDNSISGDAILTTTDKPGRSSNFSLQASQINLSIEPSEIVDGSFEGDVVLQSPFDVFNPQTRETISISTFEGDYDGTFYGPVADSVGAQIAGETVDDSGENNLAIVGAFIGSR